MIRSFNDLRCWFKLHQSRLVSGDKLPSISEVAKRAGCHRDTIYSLLNGQRVEPRIQYALSWVIDEIEEETRGLTKTKLMNIQIGSNG